jgi:hypothetical protein
MYTWFVYCQTFSEVIPSVSFSCEDAYTVKLHEGHIDTALLLSESVTNDSSYIEKLLQLQEHKQFVHYKREIRYLKSRH